MIRPTLFVSRRDHKNIGDMLASPYRYFGKELPFPLAWEIHARRRVGRVVPALLRKNAGAIIVGGGGLLGQPYFERDIEFWTGSPAPAILWGAGHNSHNLFGVDAARPGYEEYGKLPHFALYGIRDYGLGLNWVPCVSCMDEEFSKPTNDKLGTLVVLHRDMRLEPDKVRAIIDQAGDGTVLFNDCGREEFIGSIRSARRVVTNSYHAAYFGTLTRKPVVVVGGGSKVLLLKHKVAIAPAENWQRGFDEAEIHPEALDECRQANIDFLARVKSLLGSVKTRPYQRDSFKERAGDEAVSSRTFPPVLKNRVPRVVHFVFGLSPDFGGKPFNIMHQVAVRTAAERIKPEAIVFHHHYKPDNDAFRSIEGLLTLNKIDVPEAYMGRKLTHFAHKADIARMNILKDNGGIYLDLDTLTVRNFDEMLDSSFTIGLQRSARFEGLCNAVMLSAPNDPFLVDWLNRYEHFSDGEWDQFSVRLPYLMWRSGHWSMNVQPFDRFHWPTGEGNGLKLMFEEDHEFPNAAIHHLWESWSYKKYFGALSDADAAQSIKAGKSTYSRLARPFL